MSPAPGYGKKTIAALLLAIFLFIHAGKIFHNHPCGSADAGSLTVLKKQVSPGCSICEFQLSKDAQLPVHSGASIPGKALRAEYIVSVSDFFSSDLRSFSGRGPPALL